MAAELPGAIDAVSDERLAAALAGWRLWSPAPAVVRHELAGGLTNRSYLLQAGTAYYVLRLGAQNAQALGLNRNLEFEILRLACKAGITPAVVFNDPAGDILITEYRIGTQWTSNSSRIPQRVRLLAGLLQTIQRLPKVDGELNLRRRAEHYWQFIDKLKGNAVTPLREVRRCLPLMDSVFARAEDECTNQCLCHNDLLAENILVTDNDQLLALDWEYAAMGDPYFDLAVIVEGHALQDNCVRALLESYTDCPLTAQLQRLAPLRIIYCYLDLLWSILQSEAREQILLAGKLERLRFLLGPQHLHRHDSAGEL